MLRYHVLVPAGVFVILLVIGVPLGTAFVVGMMTGCMSMMVMMAGVMGRRGSRERIEPTSDKGHPDRSR
jgi:hypothetical protein